jgi:hypothetical protein
MSTLADRILDLDRAISEIEHSIAVGEDRDRTAKYKALLDSFRQRLFHTAIEAPSLHLIN